MSVSCCLQSLTRNNDQEEQNDSKDEILKPNHEHNNNNVVVVSATTKVSPTKQKANGHVKGRILIHLQLLQNLIIEVTFTET